MSSHGRIRIPRPLFDLTAWLLAPRHSIGPEGDAELRLNLFRRLEAVLYSAIATGLTAIFVFRHHTTSPIAVWLGLELILASVRIPLLVHLMRLTRKGRLAQDAKPWMFDLFVTVGTLWSALLGYGSCATLLTNDPGLSILVALLGMSIVGAQCIRNPGSPRLNILQMTIIVAFFCVGCLTSAIPLVSYAGIMAPLYMLAMGKITLQSHEDAIEMIGARLENWRRAVHCPLTDLPNRVYFGDSLREALEQAEAAGGSVVLLGLDLDGFKAVNDRLGHPAGDRLLQQVAQRLRSCAPPGTIAARLGGDEFAVLMPGATVAAAEAHARALIETIARPYDLDRPETVRVGVSIGIAAAGATADTDLLLARTDQALYAAKRGGRGTFHWYGSDDATATLGIMADRMRAAETSAYRTARA